MRDWIDVDPYDWYYRSVVDSERMFLDASKSENIINGIPYNVFEPGLERRVEIFTSTEGQVKFDVPGFTPDSRMEVRVYVDGSWVPSPHQEKDAVFLPSPIAGGKEVVVYATGVPKMMLDGCREQPQIGCSNYHFPMAILENSDAYLGEPRFTRVERVTCLNKSLKKVTIDSELPVFDALNEALSGQYNSYAIVDGVIYVTYDLNEFPVYVTYSYSDGRGNVLVKYNERVEPYSSCCLYLDRYFPNVGMTRAEFVTILHRMTKSLFNKYTDREFRSKELQTDLRYIADRSSMAEWAREEVVPMLELKYLDGCYVLPLYEDNTFEPNACITRAEMTLYLNRLIEWFLERFR